MMSKDTKSIIESILADDKRILNDSGEWLVKNFVSLPPAIQELLSAGIVSIRERVWSNEGVIERLG